MSLRKEKNKAYKKDLNRVIKRVEKLMFDDIKCKESIDSILKEKKINLKTYCVILLSRLT